MTAGNVPAAGPFAPLYNPAPRKFTGVYAKSTKYDSTGRVLLTDNGISVYGTSYLLTRRLLLLFTDAAALASADR